MKKEYVFQDRNRPWHWRPEDEFYFTVDDDGESHTTIVFSGEDEEEVNARIEEFLRRQHMSPLGQVEEHQSEHQQGQSP